MLPILEYVLGGFWRFIGAMILLAMLLSLCVVPFNFMFRLWNRFMRHLNIRRAGWPPPHCDADGDPVKPPAPKA